MDGEHRGLNWGCGPHPVDGWWNSDVNDYGQEHVGSILNRLPARDGFFDGIVANHSLQCLAYDELEIAVSEFARLLRPGGRLRVLVPDVVAAFVAFKRDDTVWPGFAAITEPWSLDRKFAHYLTWGGSNRSAFTHASLVELLDRHGLRWWDAFTVDGEDWSWLRALDSRLGESIQVEAVKP